jgi:hypothetical protein
MPGTAHTRLTVSGVLGAPSAPYEIFSFGFAIAHDGDLLTTAQQASIQTAVETFFGSPGAKISSSASIKELVFAHKDASGAQDSATIRRPSTQAGQSGALPMASQVALAVSLRGPGTLHPVRGRFYLPLPGMSVNAGTGLLSVVDVQGVADAAATMINSIHALGSTVRVAIDSKSGVVPVTEVRVGRVLDTIRTRRNQMPEGYVGAQIALTP